MAASENVTIKKAARKPAKKTAALKTTPTGKSVKAFIAATPNEQRRADAQKILELMTKWTGETAKMWGPSIVGFGSYRYKYDSGHEGEMCIVGFSPRAAALVLYVMGGSPTDDPLIARLGKCKTSKACLYVNRLSDIDIATLEKIVARSLAYTRKTWVTKSS